MERSNETWLAHLSGSGPSRQAAVSDLRDKLLRNLTHVFSARTDRGFLEDAVQDALIRILDRLVQFEGRSRFVTWATAVAIRVAMSEMRRRRWKDVSLDQLIEETDFTPRGAMVSAPDVIVSTERQAILDKMYELIRHELTDKQRTVLLAELKGMPQDEIARRLGSNRNAIYKLTHDARKRLKHCLEIAGYHAEDVQTAFDL